MKFALLFLAIQTRPPILWQGYGIAFQNFIMPQPCIQQDPYHESGLKVYLDDQVLFDRSYLLSHILSLVYNDYLPLMIVALTDLFWSSNS